MTQRRVESARVFGGSKNIVENTGVVRWLKRWHESVHYRCMVHYRMIGSYIKRDVAFLFYFLGEVTQAHYPPPLPSPPKPGALFDLRAA